MSARAVVGAALTAAVVGPLALMLATLLMFGAVLGAQGDASASAGTTVTCMPSIPLGAATASTTLAPDQARNAAVIIEVGQRLGVPPQGWVVAIATAFQESGIHNLDYGDADSLGIFQQRTSWGSVTERRTPQVSARMFYQGGSAAPDGWSEPGLLDVPGWQQMSVAEAAQSVQVSAFPSAYAAHETAAVKVVDQLAGVQVQGGCGGAVVTGRWQSPLHVSYDLTAGFGQCSGLWGDCHTGQDLAVPVGTAVYAAAGGVVASAGWGGAYGNLVTIRHPGGVTTYYAHLSGISVRTGQTVRAGQRLGESGQTGNTTGPHLHFETRVNDAPVDPRGFMANRGVRL